jgi:hypothetical protein
MDLLVQLSSAKEDYYAKRIELEHARMKCPWWDPYLEALQKTDVPLDHSSPEAFQEWKQLHEHEVRLNMLIVSETQQEQQAEEAALQRVNFILRQIEVSKALKIESKK